MVLQPNQHNYWLETACQREGAEARGGGAEFWHYSATLRGASRGSAPRHDSANPVHKPRSGRSSATHGRTRRVVSRLAAQCGAAGGMPAVRWSSASGVTVRRPDVPAGRRVCSCQRVVGGTCVAVTHRIRAGSAVQGLTYLPMIGRGEPPWPCRPETVPCLSRLLIILARPPPQCRRTRAARRRCRCASFEASRCNFAHRGRAERSYLMRHLELAGSSPGDSRLRYPCTWRCSMAGLACKRLRRGERNNVFPTKHAVHEV